MNAWTGILQYTADKWNHKEHSQIDKPVLVFPVDAFPQLLKKKISIIT